MNTFFSRSSFNGSGRTFVVAAIAVMTLVLAPGAQAALGTCDNANNIDVESTGGTASAGYATLSAAFAAINAGTHTGTITVEVCGNTAEPAAGAILNASGSGAASYGTILVNPVGGAPRTITGAATAGLPLVDLNGADNVTINGLNTGGDALTIANTTASATSGTATIRFIGGATLNTITNTSIQGSFSATVATNGGTIYFATDAVTANGNDNNTISNCDIGPAGANLPTKGIFINGSTTTTALANSGIVINNNNIHDYFGASVASAGIYVGSGGSTDDNFTNNRFYQSATRTQVTTASQHSAIWITNTAGNNFLVAGNTIGFATSAGTGTYTFVTISGSSFVPIFLSVGTTTATSVQGNTIAGIAISGAAASTGTSATFRGLYVSSGLTTVGDVVGNTIGSQVATGSITFTSSSASTADVMGMYNFGSSNWTTNNNTIGGITASNSSTGAVNFYGLRVNTGSAVTFTCQNNTIGGNVANSIQSTTTAAATTVEGIITANAISTITGNLIRNLTAAGGTGTTSGASVIGIVSTASSANHTVRQNSIHTLSNTNASAATTIIGIQYAGSTGTNLVARNFIHSFSAASATAVLNGINVGGGTTTYANNMIRLGVDASGAGITVGCAINGINELLLGTDSFYFNSVYVGGSGVVSSLNTFAFNSTQITVARAFQNNIFYNARSNASGTGKNYAVQVGGTTANPAGLTLNYNVYLADGSGGVFGRFNALDVASLAAWKTAVGQDANSFDSDPMYLTPTGTVSTLDLHINPAIVTVIEGNGLPIGAVTDDFDGQTRSGLTPTDIGADAGSFLGIDLTAPVIAYTALANPTLTTNRTLTTSVTDPGSGVPTSGIGLPAIYFRKGVAGAYASTQCTYVSGSNYSCVIDYTLVTGGSVATGDTVNYYVAAQDAAATPNVITSPVVGAGLFTANPPAAGTPPITPSSYVISPAITGTKTVCASGCDYTTLTGATGIFNAVNTSVATGSIIIEIAGDLTAGEDGSVALNPLAEEPTGSNFTVHLYPTGVARAITSTTLPSGGFIRLNAADRVNIDGSLGGVGTDRSLTITEANTGTVSAVIWLQSNATDGAQNNTIKNLNVVGNSNVTTLIGIGMGSSTVSTASAGTNNNGNTIQNNNISKTQNGIVTLGLSAAAKNTGNVITQNLINTASPNNVAKNGIQVGFENAIQITNNNVSGMAQASSPDVFGITLGITGISTTTFTGNEVTNAIVSGNVIGTVRNTGTFSACGLCVAPATSGTNQIFNNVLTGVSANGTGGDFSVGILIGGGAGSTTQVYFNSVSMNGTQTGGSDKSYALAIGGADPIVDVRNNALYNTLNNGTGNNYAVAFGYSTFVNLTSNKNDLFVTTPSALHFAGATASLSAPTNQATLANLQAATGKDALSIGLDPLFNNPLSNLQPLLGSPLVGAGTPVGIPLDILGVVRSASTPTIGAYELAIDTAGPVIVYTALGNTTSALNRTLSVTVTDASGVPTSGIGLPAIYFRKGVVGAFATTQCSHISGSSYDCLIDYALVTGGSVAPGDTVQYYVAAQDSIGNVSVSPATGASGLTANPPAAATAPTTPSSYLISIGYSSSYTVGSGGTYPSLTNPGGIFEAINAGVLTGNVTIDIVSDLTGETGAVALNQWAEDGVGPYTLLIKPSGAPRQILGSNIGALIRLNGADRVTIDGSTTGAIATGVGGNSAIRELTIQNTNTGTSAAVIAVGSGTNGAQNNTIRNVNVLGQDPTTTLIGISLGGTAPGTVGTDNDNNRVENCSVKRALFGIYSAGADAVNPNTGTVITMNETSAVAGDRIRRVGVMVFNENGIGITQNSINGISTNESADGIGIAVGNQSVDSTNTTAGGVTNALVARNKINGVASLSTTGFSAVGITVGGTTGGANTIVNNMITGVTAPATSPDVVAGIYVVGAAGSSTRIYDNSIAMTGDRGAVASQMPSFGVAVTGADPTVELKNNVFYTTQIASGGGINAKSYAIGLVTTTFANLDSNYNDFWSTGANDGGFRSGSLSTATGTDYANLGAWQTAVSDDANSLEADPAFVSATTDLHIASPGFSPVENVGTPLAAVTVDIDGDTRNATTPDIGSDEVDRCAGVTCTNTACATYSCDGADGVCKPSAYAPEFTACGDSDATACNAADSCNATGTCIDRKKTSGTVCLAGTGTCDPDDTCDGTTNACAAVHAPALTACGDPDTTNCNAADSCDALGTCVDRKKASGFVCLAGAGTCDPDDVCDGTTNACAAVLAAEFTACGDPDTTNCNAADSCDALGTCVDRKKASGFVCLAGTGTCDPDDICDGTTNACAAVLAAEFTACGDTDATACNAADSCDALGTCVDRKKASGFVCLAGAGTCDPDDVCDGTTNACAAVLAAEFTACGDTDATACNAADSCDALGTCVDRKKASGFVCLAGAGTCDPDDVCDGTTNACAAVHAPALTACGDPDTTNCNAADSCDALGTCVDRKKASGFVCLAGTGTCDPDDVCDGTTNACAAVHAPALTACGDPDATDCNAADSCNATGTCVNRFKPSTTVCRPSAGGCDAAESCTGSSSTCPADASGGPATLTATGGVTGPTSYATLGAAFTAINAGTHTGAITIDICANLNEGVTPATLNSSGAGSASYISVLVRPVAPGLSVVGSPVTGFGVIQLNGADSVTIDGDDPNTPGINRDLTIGNTAAASVAANSVIRIATSTAVTSANDNTIKNLILNGNVTGGNLSTITSATSSSGQSYGIYAGGNGGATATGAPTALTTAPASALSTTTINALTVDNNAINQCARGVFFNGAATSVSTGVTITNNTIGTPGVPTPATPPYTAPATTVYVRGIGISGATAATIAGNTIQNVISYVGVGVAGVELTSAIGIGPINVNNNAITNVVQNVGSFYARGVSMVSASGTYGLAGNNITNIQNFSGSSANQPNGIFASTTATSATIELNKVTTITNRNTGTFGVQGVTLTAGNNVTFRNNVISDVTQNMSGGTAFSTTFGVVGLRIAGGTGHKIYHNSVNMFGTLLGTATSSQLTAAFAIVGTGQTGIDVRNNIFANTMTGGTTSIAHVPVVLPSSGTSAMNLTWNNNAYYTGSTAGVHGIAHVGTTYTAVPAGPATYAGLYTAANFAPGSTAGTTNFRSYTSTLLTANTNNDNASFGAATAAPFATTTDLHINTGLASTPLESGGAGAGVTGVFIDIDAQTRPGPTGSVNGGATAPDIGADEFDGVPPLPNDMQATAFVDPTNGGTKPEGVSFSPQASFTNNGTATQTGVTVRYRILNNLAVEVYNQTATIASAAPSVTTTVTFPATSLTAGSYAIKAAAELVGDQATGNDEITGSLAVESPLCGNYDVGSGGVFASLTNANGAFAKLNSLGATCSVTFSVISDLTGETGSVAVNQWAEFGIGGYTLTIRPSGGARSISGPSTTSGLIILNGADRVTIDGSVSGGTDRSLTITNTNTGAAVVWIRSASALDGSNFDTVKNCILTGNSGTTTVAGVVAGSGVTFGSPAEFPNSNNTIQNNVITKVQNALYLFGNATVLDQNWLITGNTFGSTVAGDKLGFRGMLIGNAQAFTISHNTINGVVSSTTSSSTMTGIQLASSIATGAISRNRISDIKQTNTGGWGSNGIFLAAATTASDVTVSNNFIWDVASQGFNGVDQADNGYGIVVASGGGYKIYANSVNLNTNQVAATGITAGLNVLAAVTTVGSIDLRDNIFSSVQTIGTRYGVLSSAPATVFATINTNDYFAQNVGFIGGSAKATLASWQAATGQDASSIAANPQFVSTTDLHIASPGFSPVENVGTPLAAVTVDIDGETRSGTTPDIGADEVDRCAIVTCTNTTCTTYSCDGADGVCKPSAYAPEFTACGDPDATACNAPDSCNAIGSCVDRKQTLGSICLAGSGACDPDDTCDGLSAICAPNYASASTTCGDAEGPCTNQDFCNGGGACTDNGFKGAGTICLAGTGTCDPNDVCNGTNAVCTPVYAPPSATCGDAEGPCTNQDYCNGSGACADNGYKSASTVCLIGTGTCDPDDTCDGTTGACAAVYTAENTACGDPDATECNAPDSCNATGSCVLRFKPASFECRGSTVLCDPAEFCTGTSATCPVNAINQSDPVGPTVMVSYNKPTHTSTISWTEAIPGPFNVYRGSLTTGAAFAYNQSCFDYAVPGASTADMLTPRPGRLFFYLVSRKQVPCGESSVGQDSLGADRPNPLVCPLAPPDTDGDGFQDSLDNCPLNYNPSQSDVDSDNRGDACDNCVNVYNPDQLDSNNNGIGDACDPL